MRQPPRWIEFFRYPVTAGTALLAIGVTLASHIGALHLIFNIYWLWVFGTLIEEVYGHLRAAALVLLFAVGPNAFEYAFSSGGVGLSGVGYGLFGLLWVLSKRDERFREAIDPRTIQLFVIWFFICIAATAFKLMNVGNVAHGMGAVLGVLTGLAITMPERRAVVSAGAAILTLFGVWAAALGRPIVNFSATAGYEECARGYDALIAKDNPDALRWFGEAVKYRSVSAACWYDLGIAHQGSGNEAAALNAYRKAAEMGDSSAQFSVGALFESGHGGLGKDSSQALYWYHKAAEHGSAEVLNSVAWVLATSTDAGVRDPESALRYARRAIAEDKEGPKPHILDTLAEAYFVNEQYSEAVRTEQQAIAAATAEEKDRYQENLEKYQRAVKGDGSHPGQSKTRAF